MQSRPPSPDDQSQVRIQDLSIKSSASMADLPSLDPDSSIPPAPPRAPAPADPSSSSSPGGGNTNADDRERGASTEARATGSSPLKRKNKRASLSPTAKKKTSLSDVVIAEGELVVAEERAQRDRDTVLRTLGSIYCVLVVKNNTALYLQTVSEHKHHLIDLEVAKMELFRQEALKEERKFKLQFRFFEQGRPSAYTFEAATSEQYAKWISGIASFYEVHNGGTAVVVSSSDSSSSGRMSRHNSSSSISSDTSQRALTATQRAAAESSSRRMRSIASLCDQPASLSLTPTAAARVQRPVASSLGVSSSFLYATPPKTKHLILVRHGHYINAHAHGVSDRDQVLSQMGRQQAEFTGEYLEQLYVKSPTRHDIAIFHSDMTRAVETAHTISKHFGHSALSSTRLLREGWPGRPYSSHQAVPQQQQQQQDKSAVDSAELDRIDAERMEQAFQTFFSQSAAGDEDECGGNEEELSYQVIVCHANLIRFFLCRAMGIDPTGRWGHFEINHCGVTRIDVCEHRPLKIISVNETGHLPHSLITSSEDHL